MEKTSETKETKLKKRAEKIQVIPKIIIVQYSKYYLNQEKIETKKL